MLVRQGLIGLYIIGPPGKMRSRRQALPRTGRTGNARGIDVPEQSLLGQWQQPELDRRGETAGIGDMLRLADRFPVELGQSINHRLAVDRGRPGALLQPVILGEIDYFYFSPSFPFPFQEFLRLPMTQAKEQRVGKECRSRWS